MDGGAEGAGSRQHLGRPQALKPESVEGAEVPLQVLGLVVVGEEVVLVYVVLVVVLVPLWDVLFIVLVIIILCFVAALLARVVVVVRVSGVGRPVRLGPA